MFHRQQRRAVLLFRAADSVLVVLAFLAAYWTRSALPMRELHLETPVWALSLVVALAAVLGAGEILGTYRRLAGNDWHGTLASALGQNTLAALALLAGLYLLNLEVPVSRMFLGLFFAYLVTMQWLHRAVTSRVRVRMQTKPQRAMSVVVIGDSERALRLAGELERIQGRAVQVLAVVDCDPLCGLQTGSQAERRVEPLTAFPVMLTEHAVDAVMIVASGDRLRKLHNVFALCDEHGVQTHVVADFFPHVHSRVHFDRFGDWPLLTFSVAPMDELRLFAKRLFDVAMAAFALMAASVPALLVAALIKLTSKGPVLFKQERCGLNGRRFVCYKFRSMVVDAESKLRDVQHLNEKDGPAFKLRGDPRLTPIGSFLRRFSIDEWPQFWNVLKGDMSLVGPRPAIADEVEQYETWQRRRLRMRPGLTCLWAVRGRDRLHFDEWMRMDLEYIDTWSLALDLKILVLTVPVVLSGGGAS